MHRLHVNTVVSWEGVWNQASSILRDGCVVSCLHHRKQAAFEVHKGVVFVHMWVISEIWVSCTNTLVNLLIFKNIAFKRQVACSDPKWCLFSFSIIIFYLWNYNTIALFTPFPFPPSSLSYVKAPSLIFLKFLAPFFCLLLLGYVCLWERERGWGRPSNFILRNWGLCFTLRSILLCICYYVCM